MGQHKIQIVPNFVLLQVKLIALKERNNHEESIIIGSVGQLYVGYVCGRGKALALSSYKWGGNRLFLRRRFI